MVRRIRIQSSSNLDLFLGLYLSSVRFLFLSVNFLLLYPSLSSLLVSEGAVVAVAESVCGFPRISTSLLKFPKDRRPDLASVVVDSSVTTSLECDKVSNYSVRAQQWMYKESVAEASATHWVSLNIFSFSSRTCCFKILSAPLFIN